MGPECLDRLFHPKMEEYREIYVNSIKWNGQDPLKDKTVILYCEQGFGDIIQFSRYVPKLKSKCANLILHCPKDLHRLFSQFEVQFLDKEIKDLPPHDYHTLSMSLPFLLGMSDIPTPYLSVNEKEEVEDGFFNIGISFEGNPNHSNNVERSCPLANFKTLTHDKIRLYCLQKEFHLPELLDGCDDMELFQAEMNDFYDTAKLINSMDLVVSVDTSTLHLAGALGKNTFGLLSYQCDPRWEVYRWYDSISLFRQDEPFVWDKVFRVISKKVAKLAKIE